MTVGKPNRHGNDLLLPKFGNNPNCVPILSLSVQHVRKACYQRLEHVIRVTTDFLIGYVVSGYYQNDLNGPQAIINHTHHL